MKKVREIFQLNKTVGLFGIEVEVEGENLHQMHTEYGSLWNTEPDGSLRGAYPYNSCEYVLAKPVNFGKVPEALSQLSSCLDKANKVDFSFRTSVHVHYNVQEFTSVQVMNMIYTYILLEGALQNFCGENRINNRFCLRVRDAEGILPILHEGFQTGLESFKQVFENNARYSSLNICAIQKYGSIEFRGMQGTSDTVRLLTWITAIKNIGNYAKLMSSPSEIYNQYIQLNDPRDFLKIVLKDYWKLFDFPEFVPEANLSFSLSIDLPFAYAASLKVLKAEPIKVKMNKIYFEDILNMPMNMGVDPV